MKEGLTIRAYKCNICADTVFSRAQHDFRHCRCGALAVDGGPSIVEDRDENNPVYIRLKGTDFTTTEVRYELVDDPKTLRIVLGADYRGNLDNHGLIKGA